MIFAIQNICAKIFKQTTKTKHLLVKMHVEVLQWLHFTRNINLHLCSPLEKQIDD